MNSRISIPDSADVALEDGKVCRVESDLRGTSVIISIQRDTFEARERTMVVKSLTSASVRTPPTR